MIKMDNQSLPCVFDDDFESNFAFLALSPRRPSKLTNCVRFLVADINSRRDNLAFTYGKRKLFLKYQKHAQSIPLFCGGSF